ncbi:hypothetical protein PTTG_25400 [Puccinia triticina 1-1 BBBD Race 1]|uniref:Uncharacterized protein n=1 Tax=Puccinia triticina (isolate 1-1 / race 1 (BBBD)) TaxID=630390 RepID=A0A180H3C4_PUCT1|nr:hypothetical protein PTTG_25400 [Puccinia triticina 1-1 BBBD Race 1]
MAFEPTTPQQPVEEREDAGEQTDQSQVQPRRSKRASSVTVMPDMIPTSSDSRVRATKPTSQKRPQAHSSESGNSPPKNKKKGPTAKRPRQVGSSGPASATKKGALTNKNKTSKIKTQKYAADNSADKTIDLANPNDDYDFDQVSDDRSVEIQPREPKKKEEKYANVVDYYHAPFYKGDKPEKGGEPINYTCRWCHKTYRGHGSTDGNLMMHRDGSTQAGRNASGCPKCNEAKAAGIKLPPSVAEKRLIDAKQTPMSTFLTAKPVFDNRVLNQIIVIWQIRQAIAWSHIKDSILCVAFLYANPKALLYGRQSSADKSKRLYSILKTTVFEDLKNLDTKFTPIHDVWTAKGNRFAFIGAAVAYIDSNWNYTKSDLYKKMLAQTTDFGANNNTMASAMYQLLKNNNLALIVNAGLDALSLKTLPPGKAKQLVLGFFPVLGRVLEEDETEFLAPEVKPAPVPKTNSVELELDDDEDWESDYGNADDISDDESAAVDKDLANSSANTSSQGQHTKTLKLKELLSRLDVVIKKITQSAAQRANFD